MACLSPTAADPMLEEGDEAKAAVPRSSRSAPRWSFDASGNQWRTTHRSPRSSANLPCRMKKRIDASHERGASGVIISLSPEIVGTLRQGLDPSAHHIFEAESRRQSTTLMERQRLTAHSHVIGLHFAAVLETILAGGRGWD